jgi:hypothetical protein
MSPHQPNRFGTTPVDTLFAANVGSSLRSCEMPLTTLSFLVIGRFMKTVTSCRVITVHTPPFPRIRMVTWNRRRPKNGGETGSEGCEMRN